LSPGLYESVIRRAIFLSSPETAHSIAKWFFKRTTLWKIASGFLSVKDDRLRVGLGTLEFADPIGLAAGFDKNCEMWRALFLMGFGYLTLGTVTLKAREGNPKPRIWRHSQDSSLVNSMGLPNDGAQKITTHLQRTNSRLRPIIVSISGLGVDEIVDCYRLMEPFSDGFELNISTPNTLGVRMFQEPEILESLLVAINSIRKSQKPVWVKLPPYFNEKEREKILNLVKVCARNSIDGLTLINTKLVNEPLASIGTGGLSGPPIFCDMLRIVSDVYKETQGKIPINACGGISSGPDVWKALEAGASTTQLYTALIYQGPGVVSKINRELLELLQKARMESIGEVIGRGVK